MNTKTDKIRNMIKLGGVIDEIPRIQDDVWIEDDVILCESGNVANIIYGLIRIILEDDNVSIGYCNSGSNVGCYYITY